MLLVEYKYTNEDQSLLRKTYMHIHQEFKSICSRPERKEYKLATAML